MEEKERTVEGKSKIVSYEQNPVTSLHGFTLDTLIRERCRRKVRRGFVSLPSASHSTGPWRTTGLFLRDGAWVLFSARRDISSPKHCVLSPQGTEIPCTYEKAGSTSKLLYSSLEASILSLPHSCKEAVGSEPGATVQQHRDNTPRPFLPLSFLRTSGILFPKKTNQDLKIA